MTELLTKKTAHEDLLRHATRGRLTEADALLWMVLLHTHSIHLRPGTIEGVQGEGTTGTVVLHALTQRGAAQVLSAVWPNHQDERAAYTYWYFQYNRRTPYEVADDVPDDLAPRLTELRNQLAQDPRVVAVLPED